MRTVAAVALVLALAPAAQASTALTTTKPVVAGVQTRVLQAGDTRSREAVVFVHGHPGSADDWPPLMAVAAKYGRAVAIDMPGFGEAYDGDNFDYSVPGEAKFLEAALAQLGIDRVHLVLHDFGGPFGLEWAKNHPDQLLSVLLINTGVFVNYFGHPAAYVWHTPGVGEASMDYQTRDSFALELQSISLRPLPASYIDTAWKYYDKPTRTAMLKLYRSFPAPDSADKMGRAQAAVLAKKKRPALAIWGETDWAVPLYVAYQQAQAFPGIRVETLHAGHFPYVELPDDVAALADPFFKENVHVVLPPKAKSKPRAKSKRRRCAKGKRAAKRRSARACRRHRRSAS